MPHILTQHKATGNVDILLDHKYLGSLIPVDRKPTRRHYRPDIDISRYIAERVCQPEEYWHEVEAESPMFVALLSHLPAEPLES